MSERPTTRIVIIDDEHLVRAGLRMILESTDDLRVVGEASDGADAVDAVRAHRPDLVLMDIRMPRLDGLEATRRVLQLPEPPRVIVLTTFDLDDYVMQSLQAGATGFLLKDTPPTELINAVRVVAAGEAMLSPTVTRRLIRHFSDGTSGKQAAALARTQLLTEREAEVLIAVAQGLSNAEIGTTLFMSEATVKAHVSRLLTKLDLHNRVQVAILAHDAGLLD
ncbi:MAG: two component transcriptional regulator, LuxR family [Ilumatobacteraceae bacterium]|nr:two component transcriptional regulator, LuxR family [Ilumatobacteraceae bacterium]MCU1391320.1 two component transcriptional regulator, LuxR family [Ilumatobacteraceae bacterium]